MSPEPTPEPVVPLSDLIRAAAVLADEAAYLNTITQPKEPTR